MSEAREQSVQEFISRQPSLTWRRRVLCAWIRFWMRALSRMTITGTEWIPDSGPVLLIMNHVTSLDPVIVLGAVPNRFVVPMSKVENARHPFIGPFMWWYGAYTVQRGEVDRKALLNSIELLKAGQMIAISPEGTRSPQGLTQAKDGVAYLASKSDAVIVPIAVSGTSNWPRTVLLLRRPRMNVNFGRPFRLNTGGRARIPREDMAEMSEQLMYQLAAAITEPALRGAYSDLSQARTDRLIFVDPHTGQPLSGQSAEPEPVAEGGLARE